MNVPSPRLRLFAGPNGSGKSTIKSLLSPDLLGVYVNPDEIQASLGKYHCLQLDEFSVEATTEEWNEFAKHSDLLRKASLENALEYIAIEGNTLAVEYELGDKAAYLASVLSDFLRRSLLNKGLSFSFESVMSSRDKIQLLQYAQSRGYRTYLYYIATESPEINVSRVRTRVLGGGHDVPTDKIVSRYHRSLGLLMDAIKATDRAYIFDNSGASLVWVAEITNGTRVELKTATLPNWFNQAVWEKLESD